MSSSAPLLLIGHGSIRYPDAAAAMQRHAKTLRGTMAQVEVALLNGSPSVDDALAQIMSPRLHVVPFFMEDGYFTRIAVPKALGSHPVALCPPVGVHDGIVKLIERRAHIGCAKLQRLPHETAVVVVGHGSASAPGRALALHRHVARLAATFLFARAEAACLEEKPFVSDVLRGLRGHPVAVVGFFANQGGHVRDDLPALLAAELAARAGGAGPALSVQWSGSVCDDPAMVQIIADQVRKRAAPDGDAIGE